MLDSLGDISITFDRLGDQAHWTNDRKFHPEVIRQFGELIARLKKFIPGLEPPLNAEKAEAYLAGAEDWYVRNDFHQMLAVCCYGLAQSPHHPLLFHRAAQALIAQGAISLAIDVLDHALWVNPGNQSARQDLETLRAMPEAFQRGWKQLPLLEQPPPE